MRNDAAGDARASIRRHIVVGCAVVAFLAVGLGGWASLVPLAVVAVEASVPVLLCIRRTRNAGVLRGLIFHSAIALDHLARDARDE